MHGELHLRVTEHPPATCGLIDRYQKLLCDGGAPAPELSAFLRKIQQNLCKEAQYLGAVGTYVSGTQDDDPLVWSRECSELFGLAELATPTVRAYFERVHGDDEVSLRRARRDAAEHGGAYDVRFRIVLPSGLVRWVHERGAALAMEPDQACRLVGALQDVTEQQESELALRARLKETEHQLRHAQKMESLGRLASSVAHDFNNLLSVILGATELALACADAGEFPRDDLEEIQRAAVRGSTLTRQLLAFGRRDASRPRVLEVSSLLDGMRGLLERVLGEDITLRVTVADPGLLVRADAGMLEQVLMNLAVNARDAMTEGGRLSIDVCEEPAEARQGLASVGSMVSVKVTDTGTGIDEATQRRIFEPFFTTKEQGRGTGLGLSTVLGIVQQSGGNISVESCVGQGTSFFIVLPRVGAELETEASALQRQWPRGTETVLFAEDDEQVRRTACAVLRHSGYTVIEASNGEQALARLGESIDSIQLLVTDLVMPLVGGRELAARVWQANPELKVLFVSGYEGDAASAAGGEPPVHVLNKPFSARCLAQSVREALDSGRRRAAERT